MPRPPDLDESGRPVSGGTRPPDLTDTGEPIGVPPSVSAVSQSEPDTWWGGAWRSVKQQLGEAAGPAPAAGEMPFVHAASPDVQKAMSTPLARPTGIDSIDSFLSPAGLTMAAIGAGSALKGRLNVPKAQQVTGRTLRWIGDRGLSDLTHPLKSTMGELGGMLERSATRRIDAAGSPNATGSSHWLPERPAPVEPQAAPVDLSQPVKAGDLSQADIRARIDAVRAQGGLPAETQAQMPTVRGTLRSIPPRAAAPVVEAAPPAAPVEAAPQSSAPAADWPTAVPDRVGNALDPARVDIGAEQAGRATGMTTQQVRDVATPILDAAPGEASPILPERALKRIIDTLKALPKGGPEREAYVAKATSGKTQWQVENIRRTLEHLGLIVPVAAGAGLGLRETIRQRLSGSEPP